MFKKIIAAVLSAAAAVSMLTVTASAEVSDVNIDCSEAKKAGTWGKSLSVPADVFELGRITDKTQIVVTFEMIDQNGADLTNSPVALAVQADKDKDNPFADDKGAVWAEVQPKNFDETSAMFYYDDIVKAYGTKDLSKVTYVHIIAPSAAVIKANSMYITDCNDTVPETTTTTTTTVTETAEPETTTTAPETTTTVQAAQQTSKASSDSSSGSDILFAVIGAVCGVALAVAIIFIVISKKSNKAFDTTTGKFIDKKKLK